MENCLILEAVLVFLEKYRTINNNEPKIEEAVTCEVNFNTTSKLWVNDTK
jgi:hypothetical protein